MKKKASKPTRPGYTWVEDPTVQGGGFWRKLPGGGAGAAIAAGLGVAAVGGLAAAKLRSGSTEKNTALPGDITGLMQQGDMPNSGTPAGRTALAERTTSLEKAKTVVTGIGGVAVGGAAIGLAEAIRRKPAQKQKTNNFEEAVKKHVAQQKEANGPFSKKEEEKMKAKIQKFQEQMRAALAEAEAEAGKPTQEKLEEANAIIEKYSARLKPKRSKS